MNNQITNALLGVIALTLIVQTILLATAPSNTPGSYTPGSQADLPGAVQSNPLVTQPNTAAGSNAQTANPITPTFDPSAAAEPAQVVPTGPVTKMTFAEYDHDFGTVKQNSENIHKFSFTNTGDQPLIIQTAKGSCGCTVPKYPKEPIAPGASAEIEVVYKPGSQQNQQTKSVTITANTDPVSTVIKINAFVEPE